MSEMIEVKSSNLDKVGYDSQEEVLKVVFKGGQEYWYFKVPRTLYESMLAAESVGKFFNQHIKTANFSFQRIGQVK